jgi:hypothetical protein
LVREGLVGPEGPDGPDGPEGIEVKEGHNGPRNNVVTPEGLLSPRGLALVRRLTPPPSLARRAALLLPVRGEKRIGFCEQVKVLTERFKRARLQHAFNDRSWIVYQRAPQRNIARAFANGLLSYDCCDRRVNYCSALVDVRGAAFY